MKIAILGPFGWISQQPDGSIQSRPSTNTPGAYEIFNIDNLDPPPPPLNNFDVPSDISVYTQPTEFVARGRMLAFHDDNIDVINYWLDHKTECIGRGGELGMTPPERYFWERIIGRMASGDAVAKFGPYAGLVDDNQSRTP